MNETVIGFAGLTHLGIISSAAAAAKGYHVIGFHDDAELISRLNSATFPVQEPQLNELFLENRERITFSANVADLSKCQIVYISIDIPTNENGESDLGPIQKIIGQVSEVLNSDASLVILSQVSPGFTRQIAFDHGRLFYQVETLIFGRAVERAMVPERFIVGCADPSLPLPEHLKEFWNVFQCPVLPMRYESAELAKISINICLVASISAANTLAEICEKIGADWSEIVPALRLDQRIGQYSYVVPGLGISGGNLERDLHSVLRLSENHNTDGGVISAWLKNSRHRKNWPFRIIEETVLAQKLEATIAVLGLAYKENTHSTKNSPALLLIEKLANCKIRAYDPAVDAYVAGSHVSRASSALEAANGVDAVAIMTPWPEFRGISPADLAATMQGRTIVDPYGMLEPEKVRAAGLDYFTLGRSPEMAL
ncbi:MAG: nucleotide sugar dehydrogenase [Deltaproteobacteria bacterium]